jgi:hypothetical protein
MVVTLFRLIILMKFGFTSVKSLILGATLEVCSLIEKRVIRIPVGMMSVEYLPFTTDVVFGKV